ncbi:MAG: hypothetical protein OEV42_20245 [Deltaproteobacteria bacterium]|nr:hypothetical protein [Deltaproteobacteria bacterium]
MKTVRIFFYSLGQAIGIALFMMLIWTAMKLSFYLIVKIAQYNKVFALILVIMATIFMIIGYFKYVENVEREKKNELTGRKEEL